MAVKTLHLTNAFHAQSGGIATFYTAMLEAANQQQRLMRLVVPAAEDRVEEFGAYGRIYFVQASEAPFGRGYRCIYPKQYLGANTAIRRILREERPDVVEICDKYNLHYLGALLRDGLLPDIDFRPLVLGLSCERMDENVAAYFGNSSLHRWFCRYYMHWVYFAFFDHHTAVSEHVAVELVTAARGHDVERGVWVRPMGVDAAGFSPRRRSEEMRTVLIHRAGGRDDTTLLLYAGRLAPEKNLPLLIEMMQVLRRDHRDFRLLIVGGGTEREHLQQLAEELAGGSVCFLEHITDREQLATVYASCDVFVHPNPREPFGIAPLEAMASGLPLVAPNVGGVTSFANDNNAWLTDPTGNSFAAAVKQAIGCDAVHAAKVRAALATAAAHNWNQAANAYFDLYDSIYGRFWKRDDGESYAPYCSTTPAGACSNAVFSAYAAVARSLFRTVARFGGATPGRLSAGRELQLSSASAQEE